MNLMNRLLVRFISLCAIQILLTQKVVSGIPQGNVEDNTIGDEIEIFSLVSDKLAQIKKGISFDEFDGDNEIAPGGNVKDPDVVEEVTPGGVDQVPKIEDGDGNLPPLPEFQQEYRCGVRGMDGDFGPDVVNKDKTARFQEWPHVCMVLEILPNGEKEYRYPAALVGKDILVTGAHVLEKFNGTDLVVRCGEYDLLTDTESKPYQEREIALTLAHPDFNVNNHHNNFGVIITKEQFVYDTNVMPICLHHLAQSSLEDLECYTSGWGTTSLTDTSFSRYMKSSRINLINKIQCQENLRESRLGSFFILDRSFACGKEDDGQTFCRHDGGAPLVCRTSSQDNFSLYGIFSWGITCGGKWPVVYADLTTRTGFCWIVRQYFQHSKDESNKSSAQIKAFRRECRGFLKI